MSGGYLFEQDVQGYVEEEVSTELSEPGKYRVLLINDDYTPMGFVVDVLMRFFYLSEVQANEIMLRVHQQGRGLCGIYPRDIAETKVALVNQYARSHEHPLLCCMERE